MNNPVKRITDYSFVRVVTAPSRKRQGAVAAVKTVTFFAM